MKFARVLFPWAAIVVLVAANTSAFAAKDAFRNPDENVRHLTMDRDHNIFAERHFWVRGGQITVNPRLGDVFGVGRMYSPPFTFLGRFDVSFNEQSVAVNRYEWRPGELWRAGQSDDLTVETLLVPAVDRRAFLLAARVTNPTDHQIAVDLHMKPRGQMDQAVVWRYSPPKAETALRPADKTPSEFAPFQGIMLENRQGGEAMAADLPGLAVAKDRASLVGRLALEPGQSVEFHVALALGSVKEAASAAKKLVDDPAGQIAAARRHWANKIEKLYERFPRLVSDNCRLVDFYDRGLLSLPLARWEMPDFLLSRHDCTGGIDGGAMCCYLWDYSYIAEINPLHDPEATRICLIQQLKSHPFEHYAFSPLDGEPIGPHYSYNQYSLIRSIYYYVVLTGDKKFLDEKVDGKTILEHVIAQATYGDDLSKPVRLIDYGGNKNLLELKRTTAYEGFVPSPNGERCWSYRAADRLAASAGKTSPNLSPRADALGALLVDKLWSDKLGWFQTLDRDGKPHVCYSIQIFDLLRFDILDEEKQKAILGHLNDEEFLSAFGVHSLSKRDVGYDPADADWGGPGTYTGDTPELICDLYRSGHPEQAGELLRRILWWGQRMPYYPQAVIAGQIDYRRNGRANLQAGGAAAGAIIFGVLGLEVSADGQISIRPHLPPDTRSLEFKGLKVAGQTFDVVISSGGCGAVTADGRAVSGPLGEELVLGRPWHGTWGQRALSSTARLPRKRHYRLRESFAGDYYRLWSKCGSLAVELVISQLSTNRVDGLQQIRGVLHAKQGVAHASVAPTTQSLRHRARTGPETTAGYMRSPPHGWRRQNRRKQYQFCCRGRNAGFPASPARIRT